MIKSHVTQWLHAISSISPNVFSETYMIKKIGNTKSGSLKNETDSNYYKVITKCDRSLL